MYSDTSPSPPPPAGGAAAPGDARRTEEGFCLPGVRLRHHQPLRARRQRRAAGAVIDRLPRRAHRTTRTWHPPAPYQGSRRRNGDRRSDPRHGRRQPRPHDQRGGLRHALRCGPALRFLRQDQPPPPQSRRRSSGEPRSPSGRDHTNASRSPDPNLRRSTDRRRALEARNHPVPQTLSRTRAIRSAPKHLTNRRASRAASTRRSRSGCGVARPESSRRWDRWATATTMQCVRASSPRSSASCSIASASAPRARRGSRSSTSSRASTILDGDTRHSAISRRSSSSVRRQPEPGFARVAPLRGRVSEQLQERNQRQSIMSARGRSQALRCPSKRGSSRPELDWGLRGAARVGDDSARSVDDASRGKGVRSSRGVSPYLASGRRWVGIVLCLRLVQLNRDRIEHRGPSRSDAVRIASSTSLASCGRKRVDDPIQSRDAPEGCGHACRSRAGELRGDP